MGNSLLVKRIDSFVQNLVPKHITETVHRGGKTFPRHRTIMVRDLQEGHKMKVKFGEFVVLKELPDKYLVRFLNGEWKGKHKYLPKNVGEDYQEVTNPPLLPEEKPRHMRIGDKIQVNGQEGEVIGWVPKARENLNNPGKIWDTDHYRVKIKRGADKGRIKIVPKDPKAPIISDPVNKPRKPAKPWTSAVPKITTFPSFIIPSAEKRINKLAKKVPDIKYLVDKKATVVKILKGAHHPKKIRFNGIAGIFKGVGNLKTGKFLPSKKNVLTEICSYEVSRALKFNFVPPTISKVVDGEFGTVQQFVPGIEGIKIPMAERKNIYTSKSGREMAIYDFITGNRDRHDGNWMYDQRTDKVWAIDNGNSFPVSKRYFINSKFIKNFEGGLSESERDLISSKRKKILKYVKAYFGDTEAISAAKRMDFMVKTGRMVHGWVEEKTLR